MHEANLISQWSAQAEIKPRTRWSRGFSVTKKHFSRYTSYHINRFTSITINTQLQFLLLIHKITKREFTFSSHLLRTMVFIYSQCDKNSIPYQYPDFDSGMSTDVLLPDISEHDEEQLESGADGLDNAIILQQYIDTHPLRPITSHYQPSTEAHIVQRTATGTIYIPLTSISVSTKNDLVGVTDRMLFLFGSRIH